MKLVVRNMVCDRCRAAVKRVLETQGMAVKHVDLGEVELEREPDPAQLEAARALLEAEGFELVDSREAAMIALIKAAIVKLVHHSEVGGGRVKLSEHLSGREVLRSQLVNGRLEVGTLTPGQYVLILSDNTGRTGTARFEKR